MTLVFDPAEQSSEWICKLETWRDARQYLVEERSHDRSHFITTTCGLSNCALAAAGFVLNDIVEPEWPEQHDRTWGGWSRARGLLIPGTAIYLCHLG